MDNEPIDLRPHLVCLNLQQALVEQLGETDTLTAVLWRIRSCLTWARKVDMPIVHVHTARVGALRTWSPPIRGFEPLHTEVVIAKRAIAAFADPEWNRSVASKGRRFFLTGLSLDSDALATALAGAKRDARVVLIRDALSIEQRDVRHVDEAIDDMCRLLAPLIGAVTTSELIARYGERIGF